MSSIERIVLVRHGETVGQSSIRYYGATDVALSGLGADQAAAAASAIARVSGSVAFDCVVASPLQRAWRSATIIAPQSRVRLEAGFREIDFGHWEGLTREEIEARDPEAYAQWQREGIEFDFPGGERRNDFRARVVEGLERVMTLPVRSVLLVAHKGIVRTVAERLSGETLGSEHPELGAVYEVARQGAADWKLDRLPD
ncbi:MAG: histidine phosphatase family protein [Myxococcota bacterium]|jgi:broad specificity phosphatase PhoE|nr:histidine phosphatase family protein [Myxococcota bacterium]